MAHIIALLKSFHLNAYDNDFCMWVKSAPFSFVVNVILITFLPDVKVNKGSRKENVGFFFFF